MAQKQSPNQIRRIEELQHYVRTVDKVKKLVIELEANRAAKATIVNGLCGNIARELSHMRQRALTANLGSLPDIAGNLAVVASRAGTGLNMKIRALADGMNSMTMQLEQSLKAAHDATPEKAKEPDKS